jgi:hypothetical protein
VCTGGSRPTPSPSLLQRDTCASSCWSNEFARVPCFDAAISNGEMRLKDFPVAADILKQLADGYHWKGMNKEAVAMLARHISARGDLPCRPLFAVHSRPADKRLWFVASWLQLKRGREPREFLLSKLQTCTGRLSTMRLLPCSSKVQMNAIHYCCSWLNQTPLSTSPCRPALSLPHPEDGLASDVPRNANTNANTVTASKLSGDAAMRRDIWLQGTYCTNL